MADFQPLISVDDLSARRGDPEVRVADTRWYLDDPGGGRRGYQAGHLPGAVFVDVGSDLAAAEGPGRHPLPSRDVFARAMGSLGFGDRNLVVAYDDRGGSIAARLWWMIRDLGHDRVCVLDGGLPAWVAADHPLETAVPALAPQILTVRRSLTHSIDREELARRLGDLVLLDARAPARFRGEEAGPDPVAGHIPGAASAPYAENLGADDRLLPPGVLAAHYRALGAGSAPTVAYCGSGVTACHDILAMVVAGLPEPWLYPGSWSDWSRAGLPAEVGPGAGAA